MSSIALRLANLTLEQRREALSSLSEADIEALLSDWRFLARPEQLPPDGKWTGWLVLAGRGFGKTRTGAEWISYRVRECGARRIAMIAETSADGRDVLVEGPVGVLNTGPSNWRPAYEPSKRRLTWPNGAMATLYDAREPDQLRGPQHDTVWFDELAKYRYAQEVFDQAMFGLRLGDDTRWLATTTPRPIKLIKSLMATKGVRVTHGRTKDNLVNLSPSFQAAVIERYQGTRLGRQELDAEILDDAPGALWSRRGLDEFRVQVEPKSLKRVVVAVDPAVTSGENSNESGIVVCAVGDDGHGYVLADDSGVYTPDQLARRVHAAFRLFRADRVVVEVNNGGEMIAAVLNSVGSSRLPVSEVRATRGKYVRAEPVAALYEQGRVHHVGTFPALEDQMTTFTADTSEMRDRGESPDRVDALVWGFTDLFDRVVSMSRQTAEQRRGGHEFAAGVNWIEDSF